MPPSELELRRLERRIAELEAAFDERIADACLKLRALLEQELGIRLDELNQRIDNVHEPALRELTRLHGRNARR